MSIWHIDLDLAKKALQAQKERRNEDIEAWAERLAKDICAAGEDDTYQITEEIVTLVLQQGRKDRDAVAEIIKASPRALGISFK